MEKQFNGKNHFKDGNAKKPKSKTDFEDPNEVLNRNSFDTNWIIEGADAKLPDFAEALGEYMAKNRLTNSKIRSIYGEIKRIQMGKFEQEKASFFLLRPKVAYALGRDDKNRGLQLFKLIFDKAYPLVHDQKTYQNFCNLIEAILAYHKANGGKDN
ncbi:type III-A CRISPR-associated protein Csm2 [Prevotella aurantiaca]|uniref:type III-A CRISPR-associated protein Csm2 n=1 Tax=Prevotella aurantiaca TaxID=596085 RepID=UPI0028DBC268|nr:type III-A CRISPR-associated protein Csm2 [Prevotella aurantiaca]